MMTFFFFSSRRRHTRLQGDWSSDVCSSDLAELRQAHGEADRGRHATPGRGGDRDRDLMGGVGGDPLQDVVGRGDLIAGRAEKSGPCLPPTLRAERPHPPTTRALYATVALCATEGR